MQQNRYFAKGFDILQNKGTAEAMPFSEHQMLFSYYFTVTTGSAVRIWCMSTKSVGYFPV